MSANDDDERRDGRGRKSALVEVCTRFVASAFRPSCTHISNALFSRRDRNVNSFEGERDPRFFRAHTQSSTTALEFWTHRERDSLQKNARWCYFFRRCKMCPSSSSSSSSSFSFGKEEGESLTPIRPNALEAVPPFPRYAGARRRRFEEGEEEEDHVAPPARRRSRPLCWYSCGRSTSSSSFLRRRHHRVVGKRRRRRRTRVGGRRGDDERWHHHHG